MPCNIDGLYESTHEVIAFEIFLQREEIESQTLLGRLGTVGDMAATAAFLASDDSAYITGETIVVAGGTKSRL